VNKAIQQSAASGEELFSAACEPCDQAEELAAMVRDFLLAGQSPGAAVRTSLRRTSVSRPGQAIGLS